MSFLTQFESWSLCIYKVWYEVNLVQLPLLLQSHTIKNYGHGTWSQLLSKDPCQESHDVLEVAKFFLENFLREFFVENFQAYS